MDIAWIENIYNTIKDYSDIEKQKRLWLGLDKKNFSSYDEDISLLYDSFCFEEFIEEWDKEGRDKNISKELLEFKDMLDDYEKKESDKEILDDPIWKNIVLKAGNIIKIWDFKK